MLHSRKRLRIFFKNLDSHAFRGLGWWLILGWKVQTRGVHRDFHGSVHDSLASGTSSHKKHLEIFFKSFLSSVLATRPGDFLVTCLSHENRMFWIGQFLKLFSFPSHVSDCSLSSLPETLSNSPYYSWKTSIFYIISTQNLQENGMGFLFLSSYFMFWVLITWIYEFLVWFGIFVVSMMGWMYVCCVWIFRYCWLGF